MMFIVISADWDYCSISQAAEPAAGSNLWNNGIFWNVTQKMLHCWDDSDTMERGLFLPKYFDPGRENPQLPKNELRMMLSDVNHILPEEYLPF